jgi:hypothetical protein
MSDLSVFHRIDDPSTFPSERLLMLVRRLGFYGGAVTALLRATAPAPEPTADYPEREFEPDRSPPLNAASMAAMGGTYGEVAGG